MHNTKTVLWLINESLVERSHHRQATVTRICGAEHSPELQPDCPVLKVHCLGEKIDSYGGLRSGISVSVPEGGEPQVEFSEFCGKS